MSRIAVVPVPSEKLLHTFLMGKNLLELLIEKLREIREVDMVKFIGPHVVVSQLSMTYPPSHSHLFVNGVSWSPLLSLRQYLNYEGHQQDTYLFCNPYYPLLSAGCIETVLLAVTSEQSGAMTTGKHQGYNLRDRLGIVDFQPLGLDACVAVRGDVPVRREDLWFLGTKVEYIPITESEAVNVFTEDGLYLAQGFAMTGEM